MIQRAPSYITSDGRSFAELKDAQAVEIGLLFPNKEIDGSTAKVIVDNADKLVDILTTKPNSKVKARAIHGGTKKRKSIADKLLEKVTA